jgi:2-oxoglutarate/2-oxoacid ferredoxin oxidoreductase subunit alpha
VQQVGAGNVIPFPERVNDFAFKIATPNGSGSASANGLIMQAIFRMGIPVSGKNVFPSNIQGLPTWYEIRVNKDAHTARCPDFDLMVALNPATYKKDVAEVRAGGWLLYDSTWPLAPELKRSDVTILGVPLAQMVNAAFAGGRERILMKNIAYAGALAALLDMDMEIIAELIKETYGKKAALMASNEKALALGFDYAKKNFSCPLPIKMAKIGKTDGHILINGNTAAALGALYAGATVGAWYPITPATSLMEAFAGFCRQFRENPDGTRRYAVLQAEDELSAIGMVIGASWMGARSFTPTSGPGISLMSEFVGLAYYAEIPAVIFDVQRTGPSTGMPTRTQQGDLMLCAYASHGDTKHICLYPANPEECFTMAVEAFDLADRFQTPVFVLSDLDIGMNDWMCKELTWDDAYRPDRGKVLDAAALDKAQNFYRYLDSDGDGIPYRTLPGTHPKGAFFTRGSGHNKLGGYTEDPGEYTEVVDRVARKIENAAEKVAAPIIINRGGAVGHKYGLITVGSNDGAAREALEELGRRGVEVDYCRVRGFPFSQKVRDFIDAHERVFIVESNRDAQLMTMLQIELELSPEKLLSVRYYGGFPMSAGFIAAGVSAYLQPAQKRAVGEAQS